MVVIDRYRKATAELIIKLLREAERLNLNLDKILNEISEEVLEDVVKELKKLEKNGKIDLKNGIDLRNNPATFKVLKEIEVQIWRKFTDYCWIGAQVISEHLTQTYLNTAQFNYELFNRPELMIQYVQNDRINPQFVLPKIQITDTMNLKDKIEIPWCKDGKTYSQRLYRNVANFEDKLAFVLEEGITKGKGIEWMQQAWRKLTGASAYETARLLKTETMAFWGIATKESYLNMGIEYVMIVNDVACGEICAEFVDGDPIPLAEAEIGGLLPPYHPNCACSFIAYTEETDNIDEGSSD